MPWKLIETTQGYIFTWLIGYGTLLGPIAGIMIADYFVLRRGVLDLWGLYRPDGPYRYLGGFHPPALLAFVLGVLPNVPGFWRAATMVPSEIAASRGIWDGIYESGWFVGFAVAFLVYTIATKCGKCRTVA
jgi:NCS1 family nucleobase:cation symporter-1